MMTLNLHAAYRDLFSHKQLGTKEWFVGHHMDCARPSPTAANTICQFCLPSGSDTKRHGNSHPLINGWLEVASLFNLLIQ